MKLIKILHYVENSFGGKPSFVILMSDGKEYISNGCVWKENTKENVAELIEKYDKRIDTIRKKFFNSLSETQKSLIKKKRKRSKKND